MEKKDNISSLLEENLKFINEVYSASINSDIVIRFFDLNIKGNIYKAFILYIDGMVLSTSVNDYILKPLMMKNLNNTYIEKNQELNLENYIFKSLIPQNNIKTANTFKDVISKVNSGFTCLFVDTISIVYCIEAKGYEKRSVDKPSNEIVIRGSQEAFVENMRTNTSMLRRIINNENLIIENLSVGKLSSTSISVCYMKNIANDSLVYEVKTRINSLKLDSLLSSDVLDRLISDDIFSPFPQLMATERPDRASQSILEGRCIILVSGTPYALIAPAVFIDFLSSPEDYNQKHQYANLIKLVRIFAFIVSVFLPGMYIAILHFHQELLPTDLVFAIAAARRSIPFPVIVEILIMELSFELIREASLRIPSPMGSTIGIIGGIILRRSCCSCKFSKSYFNYNSSSYRNLFFCNS